MIRLTGVELRRLVSRRLTMIGVAAVLLITGFLLVATWQSAKPLAPEQQRAMQVEFERAHKDWEQHAEEYRKQCEKDWASQPEPRPKMEEMCTYLEPKLADWLKPKTVFTQVMPEILLGSSYLLAFAAFLIAASFVGAEFSSGAIGNWLTFEPRRLRVYGSKVLAAAIGVVPLAIVVLGVLIAGTFLIVDHLGITAGTTGKAWGNLTETAGRAALMTAIAGALGAVVATLLRHTAAAIGLAMGYLVLVEGVFGQALMKAQTWLVRLNFDAWIKHDTTYYVQKCQSGPQGGYSCESVEKVLSFEHGAWYLGVLAVVLIALGAVVFQRRDVN